MKIWNLLLDFIRPCGYLCIVFHFCLPTNLAKPCNETDMLSLLAVKKGLLDDGTGGRDILLPLSSWNYSVHFCQWPGIRCGRYQRVISLDLSGHSFAGTLSPYIGNLTFLRFLNLSDCSLQGLVPKEIGRLYRLRVFTIKKNLLRGGIPLHLANCSELRIVDLGKNGLTGTIPSQFKMLSKLQILYMGENNLTGEIPSELGNISSLVKLDLSINRFVESIPSSLGRLRNLEVLYLGMNNLSGSLPSSLYNVSSLTHLTLARNQLSGNVLEKFGIGFRRLRWVALARNNFTGIIPPTVANMSDLRLFDIGENHIHGNIPEGVGMLKSLNIFWVGYNNMGSGGDDDLNFISSLANLSNLHLFSIVGNQFGGVIPKSVGNLPNSLQHFSLGINRMIHGSIPFEVGNLTNLVHLGLAINSLTGEIPTSIGNLHKLRQLFLGWNRLSGRIPSFFANLTDLFILGMDSNRLEGSLPPSLRSCSSLQTLSFGNNRLSGNFSLNIVGGLNQLFDLDLPQNFFIGHIPSNLGNLIFLKDLDISENKYSGEVPIEIGKCLMLETLNMGGNMFTGNIPLSLSLLKGVQIMDLSRNNLSGKIPLQLQDLTKLMILNVSFNQLEGEVPTEGVFSNLSAISLQGNKKLCGGVPILMLQPCFKPDGKRLYTTIIIVATLSSILFLGFLVALVFWCRKRASEVKLTSYSSMNEGYLRLSYSDLLEATDQFASSNLIGAGSFGSVYRGVLREGEKENLIAVKVMDLMKHGALKSFWTECKALSKIRHKNLLRIISCCTSLDFKGNDFVALIYELIPNGSLDSWLHESRSPKLEQRLDIAIDIASALEYLHHHCVPQIAHCDLKPSNVLLDDDMVAHVGDFGLAKFLHISGAIEVTEDGSSSFVIKGTVGYIPPEYGMGGNVSMEGDMYSYGILLLEMITGKKPTDELFKDGLNLHQTCQSALSECTITDILDSRLVIEFYTDGNNPMRDDLIQKTLECAASIVEIGIACSVESPDKRMDVRHALKELLLIKRKLPAIALS